MVYVSAFSLAIIRHVNSKHLIKEDSFIGYKNLMKEDSFIRKNNLIKEWHA